MASPDQLEAKGILITPTTSSFELRVFADRYPDIRGVLLTESIRAINEWSPADEIARSIEESNDPEVRASLMDKLLAVT